MHWQQHISMVSARLIKRRSVPVAVKELAWAALAFASRCRHSNPLSFALRPIFYHKRLHLGVGLVIIVLVGGLSLISPFPGLATENTGGPVELNILPVATPSLTTRESVKVPVKYNYISQGYRAWHPGVDLAAHLGEPVTAAMDGQVSQVLRDRWDYGNHVIVSHPNKYTSLYAHLSKIDVTVGQAVTTDTVIGAVGSTGRSSGPHLHLEIHDETDRPFNPATFLGIK